MSEFTNISYLAQVRRLRKLAIEALKLYRIKDYDLKFINHAENATFKVITTKKSYLLRLHRENYHTPEAILEELNWLQMISEHSDISVQKPLISKRRNLLESVSIPEAPTRCCSILNWQEGYIRYKGLSPQNFNLLGDLTGNLHQITAKLPVKHRRYWTTEGLIGEDAKFGSIKEFESSLAPKQKETIKSSRQLVKRKLTQYLKKHPDRIALIHADLHFGNVLWAQDNIIPIDFDDCGYGFHMYDLAVSLGAANQLFEKWGKAKSNDAKEALLESYSLHMDITQDDINIIPYMIFARRIAMMNWLFSRRDQPVLYKHYKKALPTFIKTFRKNLKNGPAPLFQ